MDKIVKLAIALGALLAGGGVFYRCVIFLPEVEQRKIQQIEAEKHMTALQYGMCNDSAQQNYDTNWAEACKNVAKIDADDLRNCLADKMIISNRYMGPAYCKQTYGKINPSENCSLPKGRADSIEKVLHEAKQKCIAEAKLGL